jgi:hypothetical protein
MNIEQVDKHVAEVNAAPQGKSAAAFSWCATYKKIAPILHFIAPLLRLFKPAWAQLLDTEIALMDSNCP